MPGQGLSPYAMSEFVSISQVGARSSRAGLELIPYDRSEYNSSSCVGAHSFEIGETYANSLSCVRI